MKLPKLYVAVLVVVALLVLFVALTASNAIAVESLYLVLLNQVVQIFAATVLAGLGGVFVGMVLAHRMLSHRSFTPFERELLENLSGIRGELSRLRERELQLSEKLQALERRAR